MIEWYPQLPSTMDAVHRRAREGAPHGLGIGAREQTGGRGRRGRHWSSPPGGVWLSVLCRPATPEGLECLSLRAGLVVADALEHLTGGAVSIQIKWPNDLLLDGRKVAGILCETRFEGDRPGWVVVGVGINLTNPIEPGLTARATRLADHASPPEPDPLAERIRAGIAGAGADGGPLTTAELAGFHDRDALAGRAVAAPVAGWADGITAEGHLRVRTEAGLERIVLAGEVVTLG